MPLHHTRNGYTFRADAHTLRIEPGLKPITLKRSYDNPVVLAADFRTWGAGSRSFRTGSRSSQGSTALCGLSGN